MSKSFFDIIFNIQAACMFLSFILSLRLYNNDKIPRYMKGFFWYPTIGIIVIIFHLIIKHFFKNILGFALMSNNISLLFHFSFLSIFIFRVMQKI